MAKWRGEWVEVGESNDWEFWRCLRCRRELTDPESRALGLGPNCREISPEKIEELRENARTSDRELWSRQRAREDYYERLGEKIKREQQELLDRRRRLDWAD